MWISVPEMGQILTLCGVKTGSNIDVTAADLPMLSDRDVAILVYGTKWEYASFYTYSALICAYLGLSLEPHRHT